MEKSEQIANEKALSSLSEISLQFDFRDKLIKKLLEDWPTYHMGEFCKDCKKFFSCACGDKDVDYCFNFNMRRIKEAENK